MEFLKSSTNIYDGIFTDIYVIYTCLVKTVSQISNSPKWSCITYSREIFDEFIVPSINGAIRILVKLFEFNLYEIDICQFLRFVFNQQVMQYGPGFYSRWFGPYDVRKCEIKCELVKGTNFQGLFCLFNFECHSQNEVGNTGILVLLLVHLRSITTDLWWSDH